MAKREMVKVAYMPEDLDSIWNILIGIWFAWVMTSDVLFMANKGLLYNLVNITELFVVLSFYMIILSLLFTKGFALGSIRVYFSIIWITVLASITILDLFMKSIQNNTISDMWGVLKWKILIVATIIPAAYFLLAHFLYLSSRQYFRSKSFKTRSGPAIAGILSLFALIGSVLLLIRNWNDLISSNIYMIYDHITKSEQVFKEFQKRFVNILLLNLIIIFRILSVEIFYQIGKWFPFSHDTRNSKA
jgi:hypothetical protein